MNSIRRGVFEFRYRDPRWRVIIQTLCEAVALMVALYVQRLTKSSERYQTFRVIGEICILHHGKRHYRVNSAFQPVHFLFTQHMAKPES